MGYELTTSQIARMLTKNDINTNEKYVLRYKDKTQTNVRLELMPTNSCNY